MVEILICGDICPAGAPEALFREGKVEELYGDLLPILRGADMCIANLECPLIESPSPILKTGPCLAAGSDAVNGLKGSGVGFVNLANNHILDHGPEGVSNTIAVCREAGLAPFGAGRNLSEAGELAIHDVDGFRVGLLGMAEHEWSIAGPDSAGANPLDLVEFVRTVRRVRSELDYLVVLVHAGLEGHPYPTPRQQKVCRFLAEEGADAVVCQHMHRPACVEEYADAYIVYGQGNLVFDWTPLSADWGKGFLVRLRTDGRRTSPELVPYWQFDGDQGVRAMSAAEAGELLGEVEERSRRVSDAAFVNEQWQEFCRKMRPSYLNVLRGYRRLLAFAERRMDLGRVLHRPDHIRGVLNLVRCDSHREALEQILLDEIR